MPVTVEQIENEVKQLSAEDLRKVRELVDSLLEEKQEAKPQMSEEEFEQYLYEKGVIGKPPPPVTDFSRYQNYQRVTVKGEPISETIIKDRRLMPAFFCDSSAIVKRYINETGSAWLEALTDPSSGNRIYVA